MCLWLWLFGCGVGFDVAFDCLVCVVIVPGGCCLLRWVVGSLIHL